MICKSNQCNFFLGGEGGGALSSLGKGVGPYLNNIREFLSIYRRMRCAKLRLDQWFFERFQTSSIYYPRLLCSKFCFDGPVVLEKIFSFKHFSLSMYLREIILIIFPCYFKVPWPFNGQFFFTMTNR